MESEPGKISRRTFGIGTLASLFVPKKLSAQEAPKNPDAVDAVLQKAQDDLFETKLRADRFASSKVMPSSDELQEMFHVAKKYGSQLADFLRNHGKENMPFGQLDQYLDKIVALKTKILGLKLLAKEKKITSATAENRIQQDVEILSDDWFSDLEMPITKKPIYHRYIRGLLCGFDPGTCPPEF